MTQSIEGTLEALHTAARDAIYADVKGSDGQPVLVSMGEPGVYQAWSIVAVGSEIRMPIEAPTMGTTRSRHQLAEIDCVISVYRAGDESEQLPANAEALRLQKLLETWLRTGENPKLGGACINSMVSNARLVPSIAWTRPQDADPEFRPVATGRVATVFLTVSAAIRY